MTIFQRARAALDTSFIAIMAPCASELFGVAEAATSLMSDQDAKEAVSHFNALFILQEKLERLERALEKALRDAK